MPRAILIQRTAFHKVPDYAIGVIRAFLAGPVQGLAGIVLLISYIADVGHSGNGIREVPQDAASNGHFLTGLFIRGQFGQLSIPPSNIHPNFQQYARHPGTG